jgi:hypothetical protein
MIYWFCRGYSWRYQDPGGRFFEFVRDRSLVVAEVRSTIARGSVRTLAHVKGVKPQWVLASVATGGKQIMAPSTEDVVEAIDCKDTETVLSFDVSAEVNYDLGLRGMLRICKHYGVFRKLYHKNTAAKEVRVVGGKYDGAKGVLNGGWPSKACSQGHWFDPHDDVYKPITALEPEQEFDVLLASEGQPADRANARTITAGATASAACVRIAGRYDLSIYCSHACTLPSYTKALAVPRVRPIIYCSRACTLPSYTKALAVPRVRPQHDDPRRGDRLRPCHESTGLLLPTQRAQTAAVKRKSLVFKRRAQFRLPSPGGRVFARQAGP